MRLFLLPISTRRSLIYCQRLNNQLSAELTYVDKATNRANTLWITWEQADKGWKKQVTEYGNKLFQRIPFEEWGLKSVPPLSARRKDEELKGDKYVELIFAPSLTKQDSILETLHSLATERQALHKRMIWGSIIGMPLTIPFGLIPMAWSHWRALSGSKHLEFLLQHNLIKPTPSWMLDATYGVSKSARETAEANSKAPLSKNHPGEPQHDLGELQELMLLHPSDAKIIAESVNVSEIAVEVERAVKQVEKSLEDAKTLEKAERIKDESVKEAHSKSKR